MRKIILLALPALALLAAGCGAHKPAGTVAGQVLYRGKPVPAGGVNLYSAERGAGAIAYLNAAGQFTVDAPLEVGTYAVHVSPPPAPDPVPGQPPPRRPAVPLPRRSLDPKTSGLTVDVKQGTNDVKLELTD